VALDGVGSRRFLDAPEFQPLHARGNAENVLIGLLATQRCNLVPFKCVRRTVLVSGADTYDQQAAGQDQRQHMKALMSGWHSPRVLIRRAAHSQYMGSPRPCELFSFAEWFADQPATLSHRGG